MANTSKKTRESTYTPDKKRLKADLAAGKVRPVYLLCGEEDYLRTQDAAEILEALGAKKGDMNFTRYSGPETTADQVIGMAQTMPFFADRRVILIEDSGWFAVKRKKSAEDAEAEDGEEAGSKDAGEAASDGENAGGAAGEKKEEDGGAQGKIFAGYVKEPCETTCIIFNERDVNRTTALWKAVEKAGFVLSCDPPPVDQLEKWVVKKVGAAGLQIDQGAVKLLLDLVAGGAANEPRIDMNLLKQEMDKVTAYCMDRGRVTSEDVRAVCSDSMMDRIFKMVDRMAARDRAGAMRIYQEMLTNRNSPMSVLALITSRFNNILQVSEVAGRFGHDDQAIGGYLGINPYVAKLSDGWSRSYRPEQLRRILSACAEADLSIRQGRMTDVIAVETLIAACSGQEPGEEENRR
ncbi:MAG: DNA polymerase III subunit delta [Lachnospiraceae bacterium]|nr:DNA polymerase III subunit delta [Lachnospiraceae bacterium]